MHVIHLSIVGLTVFSLTLSLPSYASSEEEVPPIKKRKNYQYEAENPVYEGIAADVEAVDRQLELNDPVLLADVKEPEGWGGPKKRVNAADCAEDLEKKEFESQVKKVKSKARPRAPRSGPTLEQELVDFVDRQRTWSECPARQAQMKYEAQPLDQQELLYRANKGELAAQKEIIERFYYGLISGINSQDIIVNQWLPNLSILQKDNHSLDMCTWFILHQLEKETIESMFPNLRHDTYKRAQKLHVPEAQVNLSKLYRLVLFSLESDREYFGKIHLEGAAHKHDNNLGQLELARYYLATRNFSDNRKKVNPSKAKRYLEDAAMSGMPQAQEQLSLLCESGLKESCNLLDALRWNVHSGQPIRDALRSKTLFTNMDLQGVPCNSENYQSELKQLNLLVRTLNSIVTGRRDGKVTDKLKRANCLPPVVGQILPSFLAYMQDFNEAIESVSKLPVFLTSLSLTPESRAQLDGQQTPVFCHEFDLDGVKYLTFSEIHVGKIHNVGRLLDTTTHGDLILGKTFSPVTNLGKPGNILSILRPCR